MYTSQNLAVAIKTRAKNLDIILKDVFEKCGLNSNTMSALYHNKSIAFDSLAKISDELNCSVDYLLGRTNNPTAHKDNALSVALGNISNNNGVVGGIVNGSPITVSGDSIILDEQAQELLEIYCSLSQYDRAKLFVYANDLKRG